MPSLAQLHHYVMLSPPSWPLQALDRDGRPVHAVSYVPGWPLWCCSACGEDLLAQSGCMCPILPGYWESELETEPQTMSQSAETR